MGLGIIGAAATSADSELAREFCACAPPLPEPLPLPVLLQPENARVVITKAAETRVFIPIAREPERGSLGETFRPAWLRTLRAGKKPAGNGANQPSCV